MQFVKVAVASLEFEPRLDLVGPAPDAIGLHYAVRAGKVQGQLVDGRILARGGEWSRVRSDGLVLARARCILETTAGDPLFFDYTGTCNVGEEEYDGLLEGRPPTDAWMDVVLNFHVSTGGLRWLNRVRAFGFGWRDYTRSSLELQLYYFEHDVS